MSAASFEHSPCPGCACGKSSGRLGLGPAPHPRLPHAGRQPPSWGRAGDGGLGGGAGPASAEERALFSEAGTPRWPPGLCLHRPPLDSRPAPGPPESRRALALGPLSTAPFVVTGAFFSLRVPLQTWSPPEHSGTLLFCHSATGLVPALICRPYPQLPYCSLALCPPCAQASREHLPRRRAVTLCSRMSSPPSLLDAPRRIPVPC